LKYPFHWNPFSLQEIEDILKLLKVLENITLCLVGMLWDLSEAASYHKSKNRRGKI